MVAAAETEHVLPVFVLAKQLPAAEVKQNTVYEIGTAAEKVTGFGNSDGAQRIGVLWRIYPKTMPGGMDLLTKGLVLRGLCVEVKDKSPFIVVSDIHKHTHKTIDEILTAGFFT